MSPLLLAASVEDREASPIALVLILGLAVAVVLLIRSMNKRLRRLPARFEGEPDLPDQPDVAGPGTAGVEAADPGPGTRDRG